MQVGAAHRPGQAAVLILGVHDGHLDAGVERPQGFELGQVALAGAGASEDDGVVVGLGEAVPEHQALAAGVEAVENPAPLGQLSGGEGEPGGQRRGVKAAAHAKGVHPQGEGGGPALQGAEGGRVGAEEEGGQESPHPGRGRVQLGFVAAPYGDVEADAEQPPLAPGQSVGQVPGVASGHLDLGVDKAALVGVETPGRLQAGQLPAQAVGGHRRGHGLDVEGHLHPPGKGDERLQPARADLTWIAGDDQGPTPPIADS